MQVLESIRMCIRVLWRFWEFSLGRPQLSFCFCFEMVGSEERERERERERRGFGWGGGWADGRSPQGIFVQKQGEARGVRNTLVRNFSETSNFILF